MSIQDRKTKLDFSSPLLFVDLETGTVLGNDFEITRLIAKGGMGAVYEAEQKSLGRKVAIKVLPPALSRNKMFINRFEQEVRAAQDLVHPNIVPIYGSGIEGSLHFLVMELIKGKNLEQLISRQKSSLLRTRKLMTHDEVFSVIIQIAEALRFAHSKGIIHKDIKPSNIIIDMEGKALLTDFGIAKIRTSDTKPMPGEDLFIGTPVYMSPEQANKDIVDFRADIYSLGVVFFELLSGSPPLPMGCDSDADIIDCVRNGQLITLKSIAPRIDRKLATIVEMALAHNIKDRYQTIDALIADIQNYRRGNKIIARRVRKETAPIHNISTADPFYPQKRRNMRSTVIKTFITVALIASFALNLHLYERFLYSQKRMKETFADLEQFKTKYDKIFNQRADLYYMMGKYLYLKHDYAKAEKILRKFAQQHILDPRLPEVNEWILIIETAKSN